MEANKRDKDFDSGGNDFDSGFHNLMVSAMAEDWYKKHGKPIPLKWQKRLDEARDWLEGLSNEDYDRLIH
jgi:hypothetical protein